MPITGYISVGLPIGPNVDNDPYFVTNPRYGLGGLRTVGNTAERDSIISQRREQGMMVYASGNDKFYYLSGGTGNSYWKEFTGSCGGGGGSVTGVFGTPNEIDVSSNIGNVTVGLPKSVHITDNINIGGITIGVTGGGSLYIAGGLDILGNINTTGTLIVDGLVITKTGFQGYTGTEQLEPIEHVTLDGGEY